VRGILADNDVEGYVELIHAIWLSDAWRDLWNNLGLSVLRFSAAGLTPESSDAVVWRTCQNEGLVLVTGNRNADVPDSLELIIRGENRPDSLPVITLANPQRILRDRLYCREGRRAVARAADRDRRTPRDRQTLHPLMSALGQRRNPTRPADGRSPLGRPRAQVIALQLDPGWR
jgi:hypothetical protein